MQITIMSRYIIGEIFPNYLVGLGFLSVILFVVEVFKMVRLVVEKNIPADKVIKLLLLFLPLILQFTLPIAVVMGTLLAIGRLSDDSEITAMRACGMSLMRVFFPVVWFGILMAGFVLLFYQFVLPKAATMYAKAKVEIYQINPTAELSKSLSYNTIDSIKITVDGVDSSTNELINVRINYMNENKLIFAPKGLLLSKDHEKNAFPLILFNSTIQPGNLRQPNVADHFEEQLNVQQTIYIPDRPSDAIRPTGNQLLSLTEFYNTLGNREFNLSIYSLKDYNRLKKLKIDHLVKKKEFDTFLKQNKTNPSITKEKKQLMLDKKIALKKIQIMMKRLRKMIKRRNTHQGRMAGNNEKYLFHRKMMFIFSALAFALLGAPLGIFSKRAGKSLGLGVSIIVIVLFFGMIFLGSFLMRKGVMTPIVASWYPNGVLYFAGILFIFLRLKDGPIIAGISLVINIILSLLAYFLISKVIGTIMFVFWLVSLIGIMLFTITRNKVFIYLAVLGFIAFLPVSLIVILSFREHLTGLTKIIKMRKV